MRDKGYSRAIIFYWLPIFQVRIIASYTLKNRKKTSMARQKLVLFQSIRTSPLLYVN